MPRGRRVRPARNPGAEAIATAVASIEGSTLHVVDVAHLVALKLYAGGPQSASDVAELLTRNPEADLDAIASLCERFGLSDEFSRLRDALR